ncbi:cytochrome-c peroxidase [Pseudoalteromonas sp. MMG010]|uniref:cytochrome-c peroxidase n=1 Tax=Pseudoalteromonas sp. MMG010 TaxID=2822685 RepID=UPI001B3A6AB5|nr:cytochrome-c peroxidase [Pseudoalteromonas sp. MMG010]MBQ4832116.1 cytochrome-c peroxidase [Pseudoalteromonas sp. MMG010]
MFNFFILLLLASVCLNGVSVVYASDLDIKQLRKIYTQDPKFWPKPLLDEGVEHSELGLLDSVKFPSSNPFTKAKMKLGQQLFNDGRLSRSEQIACASCHDPDLAWADGRKKSFGHNRQQGKRNAPSIENVGYSSHFFWDGRALSLESQALMPIQDPLEMNFTLPELEQRLANIADYKAQFKAAFGDEKVTVERIGMALATFQRTITSRKSDFDYFMLASKQQNPRTKNIYQNKLSDSALLGLHLFRTKARCINCHSGAMFSDQKFHNIGLTFYKHKNQDLGRYNVTAKAQDVGKFKTPSLRGVMNGKPWMHNGLFVDMQGIVNLYNVGGGFTKPDANDPLSPQLSPHIKPLALTQEEISALLEFLNAITAKPARGPANVFLNAK